MQTIRCHNRNIRGTVSLPSSKSIVNRLLIIRALSANTVNIQDCADCGDTLLMRSCLDSFQETPNIHAQNAGTVYRFLTAFLSIQTGEWTLTGTDRMLERPVKPLVDALHSLGAPIRYLGKSGYPPLLISGTKLPGGKVAADGSNSSQFISALLLIAPALEQGLEITVTGGMSSLPYIDMTIELMNRCGAQAVRHDNQISVNPGSYKPTTLSAEADWSSAAFFFEIAALSQDCNISLQGLHKHSLQGDSILPQLFLPLGVQSQFTPEGLLLTKEKISTAEFSYDFSACPDLFLPVAMTCAGLGTGCTARGIQSLRIKESDRLHSALQGLAQIGTEAGITDDNTFFIKPRSNPPLPHEARIRSFGDHRVAMAFAPLALKIPAILLDDVTVAGKSFPGFELQIRQLGFDIR